jgi:ADP-heptose:LPS heptosyltransferase
VRRLLIRPGGIGDCILCFPAMEALAADYTEVWVPGTVVPLIQFADRARPIASTGIDLFGLPGVEPPTALGPILAGFDEIVSWYGSNRDDFRKAVNDCGARCRFLSALPDSKGPVEHAADFFARQVGAPTPAVPRVRCGKIRNEAVWLHPFSGSARKNWPYERFQDLAARLQSGAAVEWAADRSGNRFDDLGELARHLAGGRAYVGNDSGISHLAAAAGAATIALFGASDSRIWAPRGRRVTVVVARELDAITPGEVARAVELLL